MRKFILITISVLLMMLSITGCDGDKTKGHYTFDQEKVDSKVIEGNNEFAFSIFKELNKEDRDKNVFISPLSISTALSMTYQGARGTTKDVMAEALRYKGTDMETLNESYKSLLPYLKESDDKTELNISNSIWIREAEDIKEDFLKTNKEVFGAYVTQLDFSKDDASDTINQWVSQATKGKIKKIITPPILPDVAMYLINAIYFKGEWTEGFDKKKTVKSEFHIEEGTTTEAMMMYRKSDTEYGVGEDYKAIRLPYGDGKTAMYCILPKEDLSVNDFVKAMDLKKWHEIKSSISEANDVIVKIPRFKVDYGVKNLQDSLTELGMGEAFSNSANFTGIREKIAINRVLHKAVIEVNEVGSEAAAVTVVEVTDTAAVSEPTTFIADRPFIFMIVDDESETILFMGKLATTH